MTSPHAAPLTIGAAATADKWLLLAGLALRAQVARIEDEQTLRKLPPYRS